MNDLFINTTTYYVIAVIVYIFIAVNGVLLNIESVRKITLDIINKLKVKLRELKPIVDTSNIIFKYLLKPIGIVLIKVFEFIFFIADHINKAEYYFENRGYYRIIVTGIETEPVGVVRTQ